LLSGETKAIDKGKGTYGTAGNENHGFIDVEKRNDGCGWGEGGLRVSYAKERKDCLPKGTAGREETIASFLGLG